MFFRACFTLIAIVWRIVNAARLRQLPTPTLVNPRATSTDVLGDMKVKLWTWNSLNEDFKTEADKIFSSDADLLVTCQTEAKVPIRQFATDNWQIISHARHAGFSGGVRNNQFLSVFLRKPKSGSYDIQLPAEEEWAESFGAKNPSVGRLFKEKLLGKDKVMQWSAVRGLVNVTTRTHQTSSTGKGGASATMTFEATVERKATTVMVLCAHLDAFQDSKRLKGLVKMFSEMRPEIKVRPEVLEMAPCIVFDSHLPECQSIVRQLSTSMSKEKDRLELQEWLKRKELGSATTVDSVIIVGDLNYRLRRRDTIDGTPFETTDMDLITSKIVTPSGRQLLALADPLNPNPVFGLGAQLVRAGTDSGFAFSCNMPFGKYPPTYKLYDSEACAGLGRALQDCDLSSENDCVSKMNMKLAMRCYVKQPKEENKDWKWALKGKEEMQLGWLDRACFRPVDGSNLQHEIIEEEGFIESQGSDHMAVAVTLSVSNPRTCEGHVASPIANGELVFASSSRLATVGSTVNFKCSSGYRLVATNSEAQSALDSLAAEPLQEIALQCKSDLQLVNNDASSGEIRFNELQCIIYCGSYELQPDSGPVEKITSRGLTQHAMARAYFYGSVENFACIDGYALFGSRSAICQEDGTYKLDAAPPICSSTCQLNAIPNLTSDVGVKVVGEKNSTRLDINLYGNDISQVRGEGYNGSALNGAQFNFGCVEKGCTLLGGDSLTCSSSEQFALQLSRLACVCTAKLWPKSVSFVNAMPDTEITSVKLKLVKSNASVFKKKEYDSVVKWKVRNQKPPGKQKEKSPLVIKWGKLESSYLHLTVCTRKGSTAFLGSSCKIGASSLPPQECLNCRVGNILQNAGDSIENAEVILPLSIRSSYSKDVATGPGNGNTTGPHAVLRLHVAAYGPGTRGYKPKT